MNSEKQLVALHDRINFPERPSSLSPSISNMYSVHLHRHFRLPCVFGTASMNTMNDSSIPQGFRPSCIVLITAYYHHLLAPNSSCSGFPQTRLALSSDSSFHDSVFSTEDKIFLALLYFLHASPCSPRQPARHLYIKLSQAP